MDSYASFRELVGCLTKKEFTTFVRMDTVSSSKRKTWVDCYKAVKEQEGVAASIETARIAKETAMQLKKSEKRK
jgi:hypothetical protein